MTADMLARVYPVAGELLRRVDAEIERQGAPGNHPVWLSMRRVGLLPAAAVEHFYWLDPDHVRTSGDQFRIEVDRLETMVASVPGMSWQGAGGQAYAVRWSELSGYLGGLGERLAITARFADELADWLQDSRDAIAVEIATCIGSREAVSLAAGPAGPAGPAGAAGAGGAAGTIGAGGVGTIAAASTVAADLGARILATVQDCSESGWQLRQRWVARLDEVAWRSSGDVGPAAVHRIEVR